MTLYTREHFTERANLATDPEVKRDAMDAIRVIFELMTPSRKNVKALDRTLTCLGVPEKLPAAIVAQHETRRKNVETKQAYGAW